MAKKRTRRQKVNSRVKRQDKTGGFRIEFGEIKNKEKADIRDKSTISGRDYFRADLTKVIILTMLALALEFALWFILKR